MKYGPKQSRIGCIRQDHVNCDWHNISFLKQLEKHVEIRIAELTVDNLWRTQAVLLRKHCMESEEASPNHKRKFYEKLDNFHVERNGITFSIKIMIFIRSKTSKQRAQGKHQSFDNFQSAGRHFSISLESSNEFLQPLKMVAIQMVFSFWAVIELRINNFQDSNFLETRNERRWEVT